MPFEKRTIDDVLKFRSDISPFLVHLTRKKKDGDSAKEVLKSIFALMELKCANEISDARFGMLTNNLKDDKRLRLFGAVSFTETPISEIHCLLEIDKRTVDLEPHDGKLHIIVTCFRRFGDGSYLLSPIRGLDAPLSASGGGKEREKVETILNELSPNIRNEYTSAKTYHDGKWFAIAVDSDEATADIKRRLTLKRKPKRTEQKSISEMESNEGT